MPNPSGYIYKTINNINGKVYIGKHERKIKTIDKKYFGSGKILIQAINKYGLENFTNEIICWCFSIEELNKQEIFFIDKYKENSYNLAIGGNGGNLTKFFSEERKRIMYDKMVNTRKENQTGLGEKNPMYKSGLRGIHPMSNKNHKQDTKDKISKSLKGNIPWNKGIKKDIKKDYVEEYLKNKSKIPLKVTFENGTVEYFSSRNEFKKKYNSINVKYGLVKREYKNMIFESITKENYLKEGGLAMPRPT